MKRNAEDRENAEEETRSRNNGKTAGLFLISCLPDQKMLHRSGFAISLRPLRLCGYLDSSDAPKTSASSFGVLGVSLHQNDGCTRRDTDFREVASSFRLCDPSAAFETLRLS